MRLSIKNCLTTLLTAVLLVPGGYSLAQPAKRDSVLQLLKTYPRNDDGKAKLYIQAGMSIYTTLPAEALGYFEKVLAMRPVIKDELLISDAWRLRGNSLFLLSRYAEALKAMDEALVIDRKVKSRFGIAMDINTQGLIYVSQVNLPMALEKFQEASTLFEQVGQLQFAAGVYSNMGIIYTELDEKDKALQYYQKALATHRKQNYRPGIATALNNVANIQMENQQYDAALENYHAIMKISEEDGDKISIARTNGNLGALYSKMNQPDKALPYCQKALDMYTEIGNAKGQAINLLNLSECYIKKKEFAKAKQYAEKAITVCQPLNTLNLLRDAWLNLSTANENLGAKDSALANYKHYVAFKDSIDNDKKRKQLARMEVQYEFDKKEEGYKQQQLLANGQLQQQHLLLALNEEKLQLSTKERDLQSQQLKNEQLQKQEQEKQLTIAAKEQKIQAAQVQSLSQEKELSKLRMKQLWLYAALVIIAVSAVSFYFLYRNRLSRLRLKNELQQQDALQKEKELMHRNKLSESELKAIRSQMNPHFIFNVLNSIESYILENEARTASRLVQKFATLSRLILENSTQSLVRADREWQALKLYTELEAMRFNNQFAYQFTTTQETALSQWHIPPMLVQPLIENAIHHGLRNYKGTDGKVTVLLERKENCILFTVEDNGIGMNAATALRTNHTVKQHSLALKSIRERIACINETVLPAVAYFETTDLYAMGGRGTRVQLCLPLVTTAAL